MSDSPPAAEVGGDPVLALLLGVDHGTPEEVRAALREHSAEAALEALAPPTRIDGARTQAVRERTQWARVAEPADVIAVYRAAAPRERARLVLAVARERAPEWTAAWTDTGDDVVAGCVRAALAWKASLAAGDGARWDADTLAAALLEEAHTHLREAAAADPADVTAPVLAQSMLVRPQHTRADLDRAAGAWQSVDPFDADGHRGWLECMLRGGFGSVDEARARLRWLAERAPAGHPVWGAVAIGLCVLDARELEDGATPAWDPGSERRSILARAYARGPLNAHWGPGPDEGYVRNCFAYGLACSDDARAWDEFERLSGYWTQFPWELIDSDPLTGYLSTRAWAAETAGILER